MIRTLIHGKQVFTLKQANGGGWHWSLMSLAAASNSNSLMHVLAVVLQTLKLDSCQSWSSELFTTQTQHQDNNITGSFLTKKSCVIHVLHKVIFSEINSSEAIIPSIACAGCALMTWGSCDINGCLSCKQHVNVAYCCTKLTRLFYCQLTPFCGKILRIKPKFYSLSNNLLNHHWISLPSIYPKM